MRDPNSSSASLIELTAEITSAYVGNTRVSVDDLPTLIRSVYAALAGTDAVGERETVVQKPAVPINRSITDDYLICLEDGLRFKSLKRHLRTRYGLSADDYRAKWGLAKDYPMVARAYATARSNLAKASGLGQAGRRPKSAVG